MSGLLDELKAKKSGLAKVDTVNDHSKPKLSGFIEEADVKSYQGRMLDLNIEEWLDLIKEHTFETKYVPLDTEDAKALADAHEQYTEYLSKLSVDEKQRGQRPTLSPEIQQRFDHLVERLQPVIEEMRGDGGSVFVKTSSRSAKDSPITSNEIVRKLLHFLRDIEDTTSSRLVALLQAATDLLKMDNAKQVIDCFVRSQRIHDDMLLSLDNLERFRENFIVRKWHNMAVDMEFRAFVCHGQMTAMSQYNHVFLSERVKELGPTLCAELYHFWNSELRESLATRYDSYVIDFAVCGPLYGDAQAPWTGEETDENYKKFWVIELNPFESTTDGALFSWTNEGHILRGESGRLDTVNTHEDRSASTTIVQNQVVFRCRSSFDSGVKGNVMMEWRELLDLPMAELRSRAEL